MSLTEHECFGHHSTRANRTSREMAVPTTMSGTVPLAAELLVEFEQSIGVALPACYRRFLEIHNGGYPTPARFRIAWNGQMEARRFPYDDVNFLFGLARESWCDLRNGYDCYLGRVPRDTIPIGGDPGPNVILLGITGSRRGQVLFWVSDGECEEGDEPDDSNVGFVASDFRAFLDSLTED